MHMQKHFIVCVDCVPCTAFPSSRQACCTPFAVEGSPYGTQWVPCQSKLL